jgi:prepilin-type N-terminal cleavage/methylation domain-containing protein
VVSSPTVRRGFTIIEVMMATTILLVGFIGVIQAITIGSESLDVARKLQVANQIIAAEVEKLRGSDWSVITSLPDSADSATISIGPTGTISGNTAYFALSNRTATTADDNTDLASLAKGFKCSLVRTYLRPTSATASTATFVKVTYTVTWTSNTNRSKNHQVSAYFGKNGLHLSYQQS